jgi:DNA-directed RNA polymerase specialized sigma24 family protein
MRAADPQRMDLDPLARCCAEETERFFRDRDSDPGFCFELFRRALAARDERAWDAIYRQYAPLAAAWAAGHPEIARGGGEIQEFVNRAFARMWAAIPPSKFGHFRDLRSVLAYLKMCVHSAIVEEARKTAALRRMVALDALPAETGPGPRPELDSPVDRMAFAEERRTAVRQAVTSRVQDDKERLVVYCLFELDLRPKAIFARYPHAFRDVREIYTIRQVVLERLARDPTLRAFVREDA